MTDLIFAVEAGGQETILCSAPNEKGALEYALREWGIDRRYARELAPRVRPTDGSEALAFCVRYGIPAEMRVIHKDYAPAIVQAFCKADAIVQASLHWDADCTEAFQRECKVMISRRINSEWTSKLS